MLLLISISSTGSNSSTEHTTATGSMLKQRDELTPSGAVLPVLSFLEVYNARSGEQVSEAGADGIIADSGTHSKLPSMLAMLVLH